MWNPEQYLKFSSERDRPFFDLLAHVSLQGVQRVADLGCGDGHLTAYLLERFPGASVVGVDSSSEMLAHSSRYASEHLEFVQADLGAWQPLERLDLIVSNAALQWLDNHEALIPTLASSLSERGVFAFQIPANFDAPSHTLLRQLTSSERWRGFLPPNLDRRPNLLTLERYIEILTALGFAVDAWETQYQHILPEQNAVLEWAKGSALRPVLAALPLELESAFLDEYAELLRGAYPLRPYGTLLPFRRVFVVANRL